MTQHERRLDEVIAQYGVESDYNDTRSDQRYVAVLEAVIDGEQPAAKTFDTLLEACDWLATGRDNSNPRDPAVVVDLDTGRRYSPQVETRVTLDGAELQ